MKTEVAPQCLPAKRRSLIEDDREGREPGSSVPEPADQSLDFTLDQEGGRDLVTFIFTLRNAKSSALSHAINIFETVEAQIHHMESRAVRKDKSRVDDLDFFIRCEVHSSGVNTLINSLKGMAEDVSISKEEKVPWFPRKIQDLDRCHHLITKFEPDLDQDHPGYQDLEYRERRSHIAGLALNYKQGEPLPRVDYTTEEIATCDCCHELLGHIPMLADKQFAQFSQELGLASLGASDEDIEKLSTLYWFTIEFGLCKQNGHLKAYGAGLLSSYGELMYSLSGEPQYKAFDPEVTAIQTYQDQTFQPIYFVSESFEDAKSKLRVYASKIRKGFSLHYDPLTCSVEILDKPHKVKKALTQMQDELKNLCFALDQLS
ncbi:tyrosine hydroxylase 2 isoform X2 [Cetorhinus maximus]